MGELKEKRIVQSRIWLDPTTTIIPDLDYDYSYPITVYDAVHQNMDDSSPTLTDELEAIYRLINSKQDMVDPGIPGNLMTWTGIKGQIGTMEVTKSINPDPIIRSNQKIPTEKAIGSELDMKVPIKTFTEHITNMHMHVTDVERAKWNQMAPLSSLMAHIQNSGMHVTNDERARWNDKASQKEVDDHIYDMNNPHNVTAHQVGTYTRQEIDELFESIRESFFNYQNIYWDDRDNTAKLVEYHPTNWNPNYVLQFGDTLPDVEDPSTIYFAIQPATDHKINETQDVIIYVKRPGLAWQEVGFQTMQMGDMVIRYPDTTMYVWVQGRFMPLFSATSDAIHEDDRFWRPDVSDDGILSWTMSKDKKAPNPVNIKGKDGYTPIKGVDYDDGEDGQGVSPGGSAGDLLVKLSDENYDTTWKSFMDILNDLVLAGLTFPTNLVEWSTIKGRPEWYNELGDHEDGFITQWAATRQFNIIGTNLSQIQENLNILNELKDDFYDHINDFNNPHRVTPAAIGAVSNAIFTQHVQNFNNPHHVTKTQIGLSNVDNTSDMDKPISNATQEALNEITNTINEITNSVDGMNYITNCVWDGTKVSLTFTFRNNRTLDVHIPISETFKTMYFDKVEKELVLVLPDGSEHRVDISSLLIQYKGSTSDNIKVTIEGDHVIKASIVPGSIGELEIAPSVHLRMSPTTTTQPVNDRSTRIATTEFVKSATIDNLISYETDRPLSANMGRILNERKADIEDVIQIINDMEGIEVIDNLDSTNPLAALSANMGRYLDETKAPRVHTSPSGSTFGRATVSLFGHTRASDVDPLMDGTVFRGTDDGYYARGDHRHPTDITRAPMHWPDVEHDQYELTGEPKSVNPPDDSNDHRIATTEWVRRNAVGVAYGTTTTAANTVTKVVTLTSTFVADPVPFIRQKGSTVVVKFSNANTAADMKLNVQNTGDAAVLYGGKAPVTEMIKAGYSYLFTFDGTNWLLANPTGTHTLVDTDNTNSLVSSAWVRRNTNPVVHGTCTTSGNQVALVASVASDTLTSPVFVRRNGTMLAIRFTNSITSTNPTLNVQSTGAAPIYYGGKAIVNEMIKAGYTYLFEFSNSAWNLINSTATHILADTDNTNSLVSSEWVRRNSIGAVDGACATAAATAAKVVTLTSDTLASPVFVRRKGTIVTVKFVNANTAASPTMNVHNTGAAPIIYGGLAIVSEMIKAGHVYIFEFDGTNWQLLNPSGTHTLPDSDNSNSLISSKWARRNIVGTMKGESSTASTTAAKVATLRSTYMNPVVFIRQIGSAVSIHFTNKDTSGATQTTLNVNSTGASPIKFAGKDLKNGMIGADHEHFFVFDGTNWQLINPVPGTGLDPITIGPGPSQTKSKVARAAGHDGYTTQADGPITDRGWVERTWFTIPFDPRENDVDIEVSTEAEAFAAKMGDGTMIILSNPVVISKSRSDCVIQFTMATSYPSNSPCQLVYNTSQAYITFNEIQ